LEFGESWQLSLAPALKLSYSSLALCLKNLNFKVFQSIINMFLPQNLPASKTGFLRQILVFSIQNLGKTQEK